MSASLLRREQLRRKTGQGQPIYGVDVKIADEHGNEMPRDGKSSGRLMVRGPWVLSGYYKEEKPLLEDGWFNTGDLAVMDGDNSIQLTDRAKDVIKSGGEWISSIDIENLAVGCPGVAEAAVIGVRIQSGKNGRCWWWCPLPAPGRPHSRSPITLKARSPNGGCPMMSCSWRP